MEIDRKITFLCPLRYIFEASVHFKVGRCSSSLIKWKNTMTGYVNFLTQNVRPWNCHKQFVWGYWPKNQIFVPSPLYFLRLVCILKLEVVLQGYVKWKNTMTGYVNFLRQNVLSETSLLYYNVEIDRKITFLCPLRYIIESSVHFKVGSCSSRLC